MTGAITHSTITKNGVALDVVESGPENGPRVILLHGFPETWLCWRHLIGPLAEAGYHVLAPNQRGYPGSGRPRHVSEYALDALAADVVGLIEATGRGKAVVVGHDWGGVVAWWVATRHPERVERLAVLNAPHPVAFRRYLVRHPAQFLRSWYAFSFQLPWLPEALFRRIGRWLLVRTSRPGAFPEQVLDEYQRAWSEPGALTGMIHWYRAALRHRPSAAPDPRVHVPALLIWGTGDAFLVRGLAEASLALCDDGRVAWLEGVTHWVTHEEPERVLRLLLDFLGAPRGDRSV